jgi:hypothetical protein
MRLILYFFFGVLFLQNAFSQSFRIDFIDGNYNAFNLLEIDNTVYEADSVHLLLTNGNSYTWNKNIIKSYRFSSSSLSLEEINQSLSIENLILYPNPIEDIANLKFKLFSNSDITISVRDLQGKELMVLQKENLNLGHHTLEIPVGEFPSGPVFFTLQNQDFSITKKAMINNRKP